MLNSCSVNLICVRPVLELVLFLPLDPEIKALLEIKAVERGWLPSTWQRLAMESWVERKPLFDIDSVVPIYSSSLVAKITPFSRVCKEVAGHIEYCRRVGRRLSLSPSGAPL